MRAIWSGAVAFGLVNVPVKAYSATTTHDISLHQVHDRDGGRIRYERRCDVCGEKVDYAHIDKAYDDGERTVVLTDEELESLPAEKSEEIDVVQFVPSEQIDPLLLGSSYYLEPASKSPKAYTLLRQTLEESELTAIVTFSLRRKTRLGALRVRGNVLILQQLRWADELREAEFPAAEKKSKVSAQELKMARALVDQFAGDFAPDEFEDEYQRELLTLIEEKLEKGDSLDTDATFGDAAAAREEADTERGNVVDLMEALKRSVETKRGRKAPAKEADDGGAGGDGESPAAKKSPPRKRAAAKAGAGDADPDQADGAQDADGAGGSSAKKPARKPAARKPAAKAAGAGDGAEPESAEEADSKPARRKAASGGASGSKAGTAASGTSARAAAGAKSGTSARTKSASATRAKSGTKTASSTRAKSGTKTAAKPAASGRKSPSAKSGTGTRKKSA